MIEVEEVWKICASFLMALGAGSAGSFYTAMSGFYIEHFQDPSFFILMLLCFCTPFPVLPLLQQHFDSQFDEQYSTRVTYAFRVIVTQVILATVVLIWMYSPVTRWNVLGLGCLLGLLCSSIISSSLQMAAALDPVHIINATLGLQVGGILPIIVIIGTGFNPSSSAFVFRIALSSVVFICALSAGVLGYVHSTTDTFSKAYMRLSYDSPKGPRETEGLLSATEAMDRQVTTTVPLGHAATTQEVPSWVPYWQASSGFVMLVAAYMSSLAGFFGDPEMAQVLCMLKLGMDLLGRFLATVIPQLPCFAEGAWHKILIGNVLLECTMSGICFAKLLGAEVTYGAFVLCWCCIFTISIFTNSLIDITTGSYSPVQDRKSVVRTNQMMQTSGMVLGLVLSITTCPQLENLINAKAS